MGTVEDLIRKYNARILEMNETCVVLEKSGHYDETQALFRELSETIGVLQFIRSGRIAITKSRVERLSDMLAEMERKLQEKITYGWFANCPNRKESWIKIKAK